MFYFVGCLSPSRLAVAVGEEDWFERLFELGLCAFSAGLRSLEQAETMCTTTTIKQQ